MLSNERARLILAVLALNRASAQLRKVEQLDAHVVLVLAILVAQLQSEVV